MATRRVVIEIIGASDRVYARLANDIWARLSDPPRGVEIHVLASEDGPLDLLNDDYDRRYRSVDRWEDHGGTRRRRA
jgi:hypothetical protein